jgi:hypothetical protein
MQVFNHLLYINKIAMDTYSLYECCLVDRDQLVQLRPKPVNQ